MNKYRRRTASELNLIPSHLFWCKAKYIYFKLHHSAGVTQRNFGAPV